MNLKIKIGILEDEASFTEMLKEFIHRWAQERNCLVEIYSYLSGEAFFLDYEDNEYFDLLFLDIMMPSGPNGMEVAQIIRKTNRDMIFIFLTSTNSYMNEGYDVSALQYLIKPIRYPRIKQYMEKAYSILSNKTHDSFVYKYKNKQARVFYQDILYFRSSGQHIEIHTKEEALKIWDRLRHIEEILPMEFVRCHRSFIINIQAVKSIQPSKLLLLNNESIPISDLYLKQINEKWMFYFG